jgi:hypothetical protein
MPSTLRSLALLLTLAALPALAQDMQAVGFTEDGQTFAIMYVDEGSDERYILYDARTGMRSTDTPATSLNAAQFKDWAAQPPLLVPLKSGPRSPDGKTQLEVGKGGSWKNGQVLVKAVCDGPDGDKAGPRTKTVIRAKTGKKSWTSAELELSHWKADASVEPIWSPDGRRVAYLAHISNGCKGPVFDHALTFGPVQGPRVQVLWVKERPFDDVFEAIDALEEAGFTPTASDLAKGSHAGTVVFAAKGFEADAKKAAAAFPGARVEKLTWKAGFELVVVLGGK